MRGFKKANDRRLAFEGSAFEPLKSYPCLISVVVNDIICSANWSHYEVLPRGVKELNE